MIGPSGQNVVRHVAEEYNDVIAPVIIRNMAATVAMETRLK